MQKEICFRGQFCNFAGSLIDFLTIIVKQVVYEGRVTGESKKCSKKTIFVRPKRNSITTWSYTGPQPGEETGQLPWPK